MQPVTRSSERRVRQSHAAWLEHIEQCHERGETAEAYCSRNDLSLTQFKKHAWRAKREAGAKLFTRVSIVPQAQPTACELEVIYPRGVRLRVMDHGLDAILKAMECYL